MQRATSHTVAPRAPRRAPWLAAAVMVLAAAPVSADDEDTFETLATQATSSDLAEELEGLFLSCEGESDERERRACEEMVRVRRTRAREDTLLVKVDPPRVAAGKKRGARTLVLPGCLLCTRPPMLLGTTRIVTASEPPPQPKPARAAPPPGPAAPAPPPPPQPRVADLAQIAIEDPGPDGRPELELSLRRLRTEMVVRLATPRLWQRGQRAGVAVEVIAYRVLDPCSGKVYISRPISGLTLPQNDDPMCLTPPPEDLRLKRARDKEALLPESLSAEQIERTLRPIRQHARDCFSRYRIRGRIDLAIDVRPDGTVKMVRSSGPLTDTPTSSCVREGVLRLRFPRFRSRTSLHITYPVLPR